MKPCQSSRFANLKDLAFERRASEPASWRSKAGILPQSLSKFRRKLEVWLLPAFITVTLASSLSAQAAPDVEQGMKPYGSYHGGDLDSISMSNGNLFFHADLFAYSQRGGEL